MYEDPTHLRNRAIKVRFDKDTMSAIATLARLTKKQKAVFVRELILDEIKRRLETESPEIQTIGRA
ncbi:MAG: hypothetical protein H6974_09570 [Gammaproteobacteria bacterium]|nr:hypothetical protein [Gammaproteobacteria bacterium]